MNQMQSKILVVNEAISASANSADDDILVHFAVNKESSTSVCEYSLLFNSI